jgi:hypothetical protein
MRQILLGIAAAFILVAVAAATPAQAGPSPSGPDTSGPTAQVIEAGSGSGTDACGLGASPDGAGGWNLFWTNCWGNYSLKIIPLWFNGQGNWYSNQDLCVGPLATGQTAAWHIPAAFLPPEPTNYTGVAFCLD